MSGVPSGSDLEPPTVGAGKRPGLLDRLSIGFLAAVAVAAGWAAVANLGRLGFPVVAFDEPIYAIAGWRYVHGDDNPVPAGDFSNWDNFEHPPLAKYLFGLAQLVVGHPSIVADRVVAGLCTLGAAAVLGVWLGGVAGRWVGLGAAALVALLPLSVPNIPFRFGGHGFLDPVAELFAVASVALAWVWFRRHGIAAWWFAVATGVSVGLATAAKENGFLGAVGPILVGLGLSIRPGRALVGRLLQALAAVTTACLVFATSYLGLRHPFDAFRFMLRNQSTHQTLGHRVEFAGRVTTHPPGWAFLWFAQHGIGTGIVVVCLVCIAAAVALRRDLLVLWCLAALVGPVIFHVFIARVVLSFYWVMWMPMFLALVALGVAELAKVARSRRSASGIMAGVVAACCAAALAAVSVRDTYRTITRPEPRYRSESYSDAVLARSPEVYLRLHERSGTNAADSSGRNHAGSYADGPVSVGGLLTGDPDPALAFNGWTQYAFIPGAPWMDAADYSVVVWFKGTKINRYLASRDNYTSKVWDLAFDGSGHLVFRTFRPSNGGGQTAVSRGVYSDDRRHLAVCIKSRTSMLLYVDGKLAAFSDYPTFVQDTGSVGIDLARRGNGHGYFAGTLDEFAFFDGALSDADVVALYHAGTVAASPPITLTPTPP